MVGRGEREGPNGKRQVYAFYRFEQLTARLQPNAVIFSDIGPGCRWVGNERGLIETETNWCTLDTTGFQRGLGAPPHDTLNQGNVNGPLWIPAECDVGIRPGWFYHPQKDSLVKTPAQLLDIYLHSVGRGANLILNVPPDRSGRFRPADSIALVGLGQLLRQKLGHNLAKGKLHGWEINLGRKKRCNAVLLQEFIQQSQRVQSFEIEIWENKAWREVARSTTIAARKILPFPEVRTRKIKITILAAKAAPQLNPVQVYRL